MLLIASKIILCLVLATLLGFAIGYLIRKRKNEDKSNLSDLVSKENKIIQESSPQTILDESAPQSISEKITPAKPLSVPKKPFKDEKKVKVEKDSSKKKPDDLTKIKGIGAKIEKSLNELGIYTYKEIASWDKEKIEFINKNLTFKGRTSREDWVKHAKTLI